MLRAVAFALLCGCTLAAVCESAVSKAQIEAPGAMQHLLRAVAANEVAYQHARAEYTYVRHFAFYAFDRRHNPGGSYQVTTQVTFTPNGQRFEKNVHGPTNTLRLVRLTNDDFRDLRQIIPLVLTPGKLPRYEVRFEDREPVALHDSQGKAIGRLQALVFRLSPRQLFPGQRYFQGRIWVDPKTLGIVQIAGRPEPQVRSLVNGHEQANLFGPFTTYFQRIDGRYWFPVYTHGDDWLGFQSGPVEIRQTVRFTDYHRFGATTSFKVVAPSHPPSQPPG